MTLTFAQLTIDCADAAGLASFWSAVIGRPRVEGANQYFAVVPASDDRAFPALMFIAVPEPRVGKNRIHLDLASPDIAAEVARVVALGATHIADFDKHGTRWATLTDPEGNVFDIGLPATRA